MYAEVFFEMEDEERRQSEDQGGGPAVSGQYGDEELFEADDEPDDPFAAAGFTILN